MSDTTKAAIIIALGLVAAAIIMKAEYWNCLATLRPLFCNRQ